MFKKKSVNLSFMAFGSGIGLFLKKSSIGHFPIFANSKVLMNKSTKKVPQTFVGCV